MDYEKKYKEALERAKQIYSTPYTAHWDVMKEVIEEVFTELKESEDERIRKRIIALVNAHGQGMYKDEMLAWLEKQAEHANFRNKIQIGDKVTRNRDGVLVNLSQLNRVAKKDEKQGEQKYIPKYKIGDYVTNTNYKGEPIYEIVYMDKECYICEYRGNERMGDKAVMHFSFDNPYLRLVQKPADKVEPKFHEGDMIIHKELGGDYINNPHKIIQVDILDKKYRLEGGLVAHFGEEDDYELVEQKPAWSEEDKKFVHGLIRGLAAKRDIHGHTTFSSDCIDIIETINWLKSIKDRVQPQPKSDWDEEDEKISKAIIKRINGESNYLNVNLSSAICWIKSLKDRVQPQQEWSEEDEKKRNLLISILNVNLPNEYFKVNPANTLNMEAMHTEELISWLKSLRPQNRWKPSALQIEALESATENCAYSEYQDCLRELAQQLKKLRKE